MRIDIEPVFHFRQNDTSPPIVVMLGLLKDIRDTGKLTHAAARTGMSYRHAWNRVSEWSAFFGVPLVERRKGKGTTLTPFGEKLVWASQRMNARLGPQLENLSQELTSELQTFLPATSSVVRVHASHGFAVPKLREILGRTPGMSIDLRYVSNQNSLVSLAHDGCDLAGLHLPRGPLRAESARAGRLVINGRDYCVIGFVARQMGLMLRSGNPLQVSGIDDLARPGLRFVNRDPDSGTREVFDRLLQLHGMRPDAITGYEQIEFTHAACAAYVASGMADAAFGVEAAARQFGLDFIRLLTEDYFFVCRRSFPKTTQMKRILDVMRGSEFHNAVAGLPGYLAVDTGLIREVDDVFAEHPHRMDTANPPA